MKDVNPQYSSDGKVSLIFWTTQVGKNFPVMTSKSVPNPLYEASVSHKPVLSEIKIPTLRFSFTYYNSLQNNWLENFTDIMILNILYLPIFTFICILEI